MTAPTAPPIPDPEKAPAVSPTVRAVAYFAALVTGAAYGPAIGIGAVLGADPATIAAVAGGVGAFVATVAGGLGVAYRPNKSND